MAGGIVKKTPQEAIRVFRDHVAQLVSKILPGTPLLAAWQTRGAKVVTLAFREGDKPITIPLDTRFGRLYFYLAQELWTTKTEKGSLLETRKYFYHLYLSNPDTSKAFFRWEYERELRPPALHCRHHLHVRTTIPVGDGGSLNLEKLHLPTGWILMEDVFRFLISELEVNPPCGDNWPQILEASRKRFFSKFSVKGVAGK